MERRASNWENFCKTHNLIKGLVFDCIKNSLKPNNMETIQLRWQNRQKNHSPKKIYRWQTGINWKSKQWDSTTHLLDWEKKSQMLARIQSNKNSHSLMVGMQNLTAAFKDNLAVSNKLNILLPYSLAIMHLCIYPNELKTYGHTKSCMPMCIAALFKTAKIWKQSRSSSKGEWEDKLWYLHNVLLVSNEKKWAIKPWNYRQEP